jgi:hypothetical protein
VSSFQRFDTDTVPALSERDLKRRWAVFHKAIHDRSGKRWQRVLGRMLGEDTRRYKVARFDRTPTAAARPVLTRRCRRRPVRGEDQGAAGVFPFNYRPKALAPVEFDPDLERLLAEVDVLTIDEGTDSAAATIERLNASIDASGATWIYLVDVANPTGEQTATLAAMLREARDGDDVRLRRRVPAPTPSRRSSRAPSVGPHTLLSYNVVGRPALVRVSTLRRIGGFSATPVGPSSTTCTCD